MCKLCCNSVHVQEYLPGSICHVFSEQSSFFCLGLCVADATGECASAVYMYCGVLCCTIEDQAGAMQLFSSFLGYAGVLCAKGVCVCYRLFICKGLARLSQSQCFWLTKPG